MVCKIYLSPPLTPVARLLSLLGGASIAVGSLFIVAAIVCEDFVIAELSVLSIAEKERIGCFTLIQSYR